MHDSAPQGVLFVVGTPIGNLEDITFRALRVLREVDLIVAEDTRVTMRLCAKYDIDTRLLSFREQNCHKVLPRIIQKLKSGCQIALVTDAGTPSVSDPGMELVGAAREHGFEVKAVPGPSALAAAVSIAGLPGAGVRFLGFLPRRGPRRREAINAIAVDPALIVLYESPRRIIKTLVELAEVCGARRAVLCREITKVHEESVVCSLAEMAELDESEIRGEITLVLEGALSRAGEEMTEERLETLVRQELRKGNSAKDVASYLSRGFGVQKRQVYQIAIREFGLLREEDED